MEFALVMFLGIIVVVALHIGMFVLYKIWLIIVGEWEDRKDG